MTHPTKADLIDAATVVTPEKYGGFVTGHSGECSYEACFWDASLNPTLPGIGNGEDPNVVGGTSGQLKTVHTYTDAGWDFVGESRNGTADIWRLCSQRATYPRLSWESVEGDFDCPDGVHLEDVFYLADRWLEAGHEPYASADLSGDGMVSFEDYAVMGLHWGEDGP